MRGLFAHQLQSATISAGVAQFKPGESFETLIERCDAAHQAKQAGRNRAIVAEG